MRAVVFLAAHELRVRWRGWTGLVLLVVLVGGAVLAAAAGALRTASSYPRLLTASKASDVLVAPDVTGLGGYFDALARLPGAGTVAPVAGMRLGVLGHDGLGSGASAVLTPVDGRYGRLVDVPKVLAGRLPAAGNAGEIVVDQRTAARTGLQVGSMLTMRAVPVPSPAMAGEAGEGPARPRLLHERVVGVVVTRGSVLPVNQLDKDPVIMASPALFRWLGVRYMGFNGAYVQLRRGLRRRRSRAGRRHLRAGFPPPGAMCSSPWRARRLRLSSARSGPRR